MKCHFLHGNVATGCDPETNNNGVTFCMVMLPSVVILGLVSTHPWIPRHDVVTDCIPRLTLRCHLLHGDVATGCHPGAGVGPSLDPVM